MTLLALLERVDEARLEYEAELKKRFPVGAVVHVQHGGREIEASVLFVAYTRVHVKSVSGKDYWVYATRLVEHGTL